MFYNALQDVVNEGAGDQPIHKAAALSFLLLLIPLTLGFEHKLRVLPRRHFRDHLGDEQVILDMNSVLFRPTQIQVLPISDDDAHGLPVVILIVLEEIRVGTDVVPSLLRAGTAKTNQDNATLIGSEGVQGQRRVPEELLKQVQPFPLDFVEGRQAAQVFIQEP